MELKRYSENEIGNGDPVVVVPQVDNIAQDPILLGTGFETYADLVDQLEYVVEMGGETIDISQESREKLLESNVDEFLIFSIEGTVSV